MKLQQRQFLFLTWILCLGTLASISVRAAEIFVAVPLGATWKYLDDGSNQGTAWRAPSFNDTSWAAGPAELGYGDGDEATVVGFGPDSGNKYTTTYFRHSFNVPDDVTFNNLALRLVRDDGAVIYLNGVEVYRSNMPGGTINFDTLSAGSVSAPEESAFFDADLSAFSLLPGNNVVAAEVHQWTGGSSDISFNLELTAEFEAPPRRRPSSINLPRLPWGFRKVLCLMFRCLAVSRFNFNGVLMATRFPEPRAPPIPLPALPLPRLERMMYRSAILSAVPPVIR